MTTTNSHSGLGSASVRTLIRVLIVVQGFITLIACVFVFPLGALLAIGNGVLAFASHGLNRKLFAGFAIAGAALAIVFAVLLLAAGSTMTVHHAVKL